MANERLRNLNLKERQRSRAEQVTTSIKSVVENFVQTHNTGGDSNIQTFSAPVEGHRAEIVGKKEQNAAATIYSLNVVTDSKYVASLRLIEDKTTNNLELLFDPNTSMNGQQDPQWSPKPPSREFEILVNTVFPSIDIHSRKRIPFMDPLIRSKVTKMLQPKNLQHS